MVLFCLKNLADIDSHSHLYDIKRPWYAGKRPFLLDETLRDN